MNAISDSATSPPIHSHLFTVPEAAWAADIEDGFVNQEVDKKVLEIDPGTRRLLAEWDLVYLRAVRKVGPSLKPVLRRQIYRSVRKAFLSGNFQYVKLDAWHLDAKALLGQIGVRVSKIKAARDVVEIRPEIKGGEPIIRGTRIPVRTLVEMLRAGTSKAELAEEYNLTPTQIELSLLYDKLYPRRGRPSRNQRYHGLTDLGSNDRADFEELGEFKHRDVFPSR